MKAAASVRVAALTGTADALPLLAEYAQDTRYMVQNELSAGSPLNNGGLTIRSRKLLRHTRRLPALTRLKINLGPHETVEDLWFFADIPELVGLGVTLDPSKDHDLVALGSSRHLQRLSLFGVESTEDLSPIADFRELGHLSLAGYSDARLSDFDCIPSVWGISLHRPLEAKLGNASRVFGQIGSLNLSSFDHVDLGLLPESLHFLVLQDMRVRNLAPLARLVLLKSLYLLDLKDFDGDFRPLAALDLQILGIDREDGCTGLEGISGKIQIG
ncbi:hypothetical protein ABZ816_33060 [Actinosynnema sp. NPDC047251]|uniref:Uncharacterized protein n=1 Tax=Saccharothrix espanaensis (strain ATCC 51144 / DSM 44229 / JCM 9112 / NBRC 15066 / NRRL 15764) TaxID=1179773 RepID=K0JRF7_SACES|nr:hypothetical protein [Saccharothrix espanaensis]CCH27379.1 hypothetical protein BN6_00470 [Saccharothrix espanaensis DSM 44229]